MTTNQLRRFALEFRKGILDGAKSTDFCYMVCLPLTGLLNASDCEATLIQGSIGSSNHYWIRLENGEILDPTADQFKCPDGKRMPAVYIGPLPDWYMEEAIA